MICGRYRHPASACFDEINAAVSALTSRTVALNAHVYTPPPEAIIYNFENVPGQVANPRELWAGHELWDFSASNAAKYGATHVPVGYHPSMERFKRVDKPDIDVVFTGCVNPRRAKVLNALEMLGLRVVVVPPGTSYGVERDTVLARAKVAISMLFYEDGVFPALRVAHLVANGVPVVSELCPEHWDFVPATPYLHIVDAVCRYVEDPYASHQLADCVSRGFKQHPMRLPS